MGRCREFYPFSAITIRFTGPAQTAKIHSKHGIILSCAMEIENTWLSSAELERLHKFGESLENKRYDLATMATARVGNEQIQELVTWLQDAVAN